MKFLKALTPRQNIVYQYKNLNRLMIFLGYRIFGEPQKLGVSEKYARNIYCVIGHHEFVKGWNLDAIRERLHIDTVKILLREKALFVANFINLLVAAGAIAFCISFGYIHFFWR